jgi:hypothetical protein
VQRIINRARDMQIVIVSDREPSKRAPHCAPDGVDRKLW